MAVLTYENTDSGHPLSEQLQWPSASVTQHPQIWASASAPPVTMSLQLFPADG